MNKPEVVMLCGLTGSGKSTYAEQLVAQGYEKLSLDESMHEKHGRAGVDYPAEKYMDYEDDVNNNLKQKLAGLLADGSSVVLDYGFWSKDNRDTYKEIIGANGGKWRLVYFKARPEVLIQRLRRRNERIDANAVHVTESMLGDFIKRFQEPQGEGEEPIEQS